MAIFKCLEISTGHITQADANLLAGSTVTRDLPFTVAKYGEGFFIGVPQNLSETFAEGAVASEHLSLAFATLMLHAREQGCDVIRLDGDADTIDGLDVFNW